MRIRAYTWAEFNAWVAVTARQARRQRAAATLDAFHAARGEFEGFKKHLEQLDGDR